MLKNAEPSISKPDLTKLLVLPSFTWNISHIFKARELKFCTQTAYTILKMCSKVIFEIYSGSWDIRVFLGWETKLDQPNSRLLVHLSSLSFEANELKFYMHTALTLAKNALFWHCVWGLRYEGFSTLGHRQNAIKIWPLLTFLTLHMSYDLVQDSLILR